MISAFQGKRTMGRWYCSKKSTAEASCDLSIFWLNKLGLLGVSRSLNCFCIFGMRSKMGTIVCKERKTMPILDISCQTSDDFCDFGVNLISFNDGNCRWNGITFGSCLKAYFGTLTTFSSHFPSTLASSLFFFGFGHGPTPRGKRK